MNKRFGITVDSFSYAASVHYYADVWCELLNGNIIREKVSDILTKNQADELNRVDNIFGRNSGNPYKSGNEYTRFDSERTALAAGLKLILQLNDWKRVPVTYSEPDDEDPNDHFWIDWNEYEERGLVPSDGQEIPEDERCSEPLTIKNGRIFNPFTEIEEN